MEKKKERKEVTYILIGSKLLVFAAFLYASAVMFSLNRKIEGIILLFAVALWLILTKMDRW